MRRFVFLSLLTLAACAGPAGQQQPARTADGRFTIVRQVPISSVKNQHKSGTCWDFATLGFFEAELLRETGREYDLCEMFVVSKDYMDNAEHYVRMHGFSQISQGGSCDDVLEVIRNYGICPEEAMAAPGALVGDSLANFNVFFPELERTVQRVILENASLNVFTAAEQTLAKAKEPQKHWQDSVQAVIDKYLGPVPETFFFEGKSYTPRSFAESLPLNPDDYVSITSFTHHPFNQWFVIEAPYKWRLKPSYNIPVGELMDVLDAALDAGYTVAWGGDVSGDFDRKTAIAELPEALPWGTASDGRSDSGQSAAVQQMRQEQWDDWRFTYDHVMLVYGRAEDAVGTVYYLVKNSWGTGTPYAGTWMMSRDYLALNTTYLFLNRHALPQPLRRAVK